MNWEDWKYEESRRGDVGTRAFSNLSPALVSHASELWCFWAAGENDRTLLYSTFSANAWSAPREACWAEHRRSPRSAPQVAVLDGTLHVMFIDRDHKLVHYTWGENALGEASIVSVRAVDRFALASQGGGLHVIYRLAQEQTSWYVHYSGIEAWDRVVTQRCEEAEGPRNPTLVAGRQCAWLMKWDANGTFRTWKTIENHFREKEHEVVPFQQAPGEIAATSAADMLFLAYLTADSVENIETLHFKDGWKPERIYGDTAGTLPSLAVHNGTLFCAWNDSVTNALRYALKPAFEIWPLKSWMSSLADDTSLSQLTIPGTHDSCAKSDWPNTKRWLLSERFFGTQNAPLLSQLTAGVRFFDIRGRFRNGDPPNSRDPIACHGPYPVEPELTIAAVFDIFYQFLAANGRETVIMSVKCEDSSKRDQFALAVEPLIRARPDRWFLASGAVPTLGAVRGKIVLIRRFPNPETEKELGIDGVSDWPDNASSPVPTDPITEGIKLMVQDRWKLFVDHQAYLSDTALVKFKEVDQMLTRARRDDNEKVWYLNFTSATAVISTTAGAWASPSWIARGQPFETPVGVAYAKGVNHLLREYLEQNPRGHFGTIAIDFMDTPEELISMIVNTNGR